MLGIGPYPLLHGEAGADLINAAKQSVTEATATAYSRVLIGAAQHPSGTRDEQRRLTVHDPYALVVNKRLTTDPVARTMLRNFVCSTDALHHATNR